jgi:hypothetical protein
MRATDRADAWSMTTMAFDTMRFSQRPCEAGMSGVQAAGIAAATAEAIGELVAQPATKHDLAPPAPGTEGRDRATRAAYDAQARHDDGRCGRRHRGAGEAALNHPGPAARNG